MKLGLIGLGRMGFHMVERLLKHKIKVVAYNRNPEKVKQISRKGAIPAFSVEELIGKLDGKKIVWIMLPAGRVTDDMIKKVLPQLNKGDIIVDGANDFYGNAEKHDKLCKKYSIHFFDCGVSGGIWGLKNGYTLMVGGPKNQFKCIEPFCKALSAKGGYGYFGNVGAGHFVKSVHNIVEYVYLQGIAEGVELLKGFKQPIDIVKATSVWRPASVVNSWLMDLANVALKRPDFKEISPINMSVTINELKQTVKSIKGYAPAFEIATKIRVDKSKKFTLGKRMIAATRREFGGHAVKKNK
ncbi:MAG: NADP-dependent phosphogluconate dehydrogenase [Candidatus Woesearchaeota archaeon]|mgnify:CR=1 FL=1|jgi:6-phosphogluconate dehydrogenase|nr:NADP-dependent phosphogluconate dehydrogenase [Candidatus Woesearchaeota archaeon]MDP6265439.1 NADP-dependent phosphogluconate dehydrogenase [Candidatus Woesearchaeota archaeon]MDP6599804.1 NADP-dependent phosphogluconate dehydrogenase [Candidatus Woesearchaeota archaeon]MDP7323114.1 NADP-dependent phosphogluconate dehydrogenase [Candidatus Woesearchaeota archaeon]MDP7476069.1 NADP-dependent phosphogluconate dehydrogenase [Candidatus Woesearchaeota archaeon]|tara:strand:+ start:3472 stop:4365 length:894 start_codon:yes stop_codon:yes gene_type:complete